jgi:hypothetical protein
VPSIAAHADDAGSDGTDRHAAAAAVAARYHRVERPVSAALALVVAVSAGFAFVRLPLLPALAVLFGLVALVRVPLVRTGGRTELETDADPRAVREAFTGARPPVLALQWGVADEVEPTPTGARYGFSYLLGLRSVEMTVEATDADGNAKGEGSDGGDVELTVTAGGSPWGSYDVTVGARGGTTAVGVEWRSERRFGLRRVPGALVAERFRASALAAQGYEVLDHGGGLRLRG